MFSGHFCACFFGDFYPPPPPSHTHTASCAWWLLPFPELLRVPGNPGLSWDFQSLALATASRLGGLFVPFTGFWWEPECWSVPLLLTLPQELSEVWPPRLLGQHSKRELGKGI